VTYRYLRVWAVKQEWILLSSGFVFKGSTVIQGKTLIINFL
jgi:hypothetical protein